MQAKDEIISHKNLNQTKTPARRNTFSVDMHSRKIAHAIKPSSY